MGSGYQVTITVRFNPGFVLKKKKKYFATTSKLPQQYIFKRVITPNHKEISLIKLSASNKDTGDSSGRHESKSMVNMY